MLVIAFPCRWDNYMLPTSYSSVLLKEWAPLEDQWTSQDRVSGISCLLWLNICGLLGMHKLTERFAFAFLQSQTFDLTSFWRGARSRQRDTEMSMSLTWPAPGKVALLCVPSSIASGLTSCKWQLGNSSAEAFAKGSVRPFVRPEQPWHSAVPLCGCFLQGSAHHGQVWRGKVGLSLLCSFCMSLHAV